MDGFVDKFGGLDMKYTFIFSCIDNGGKHQVVKVKAIDKQEAIQKGFKKAMKKSAGDIIDWECKLDVGSLL